MKHIMINRMMGAAFLFLLAFGQAYAQTDPLPSGNDGAAKKAIVEFVKTTTTKGSSNFVPPAERIAEFDQDGTLWVEHPVYTQIIYCLDRVGALVKEKPELKDREPFKTVLSGDREAIAKLSMKDLFEIVLATQSKMTVEQFSADVKKWLATAKDPRWKRPYTELTYRPMQEVLKYMRANGYRTYIATGGSTGFVRVYSEQVYGIPPRAGGRHHAAVQVRLRQGPPADPYQGAEDSAR
jgi:haloacid dehalogenase-like hydrolase